jgi:hypothetical protein
MTKYDASTTHPITIQLRGFPSVEAARQFLSSIVKPDLQSHFLNATMRLNSDVVEVDQHVCCGVDKDGSNPVFATCAPDVSVECHLVGSGCPWTGA